MFCLRAYLASEVVGPSAVISPRDISQRGRLILRFPDTQFT